uniref:Uncharacterized protein n=1 Tax=Bovine herpesvirus 4 TaxID=10385 RepID=A0A0F6N4W6_BHV4|nr:hypothetical protein pB01 [Bovine gammaherpesvirus 4]
MDGDGSMFVFRRKWTRRDLNNSVRGIEVCCALLSEKNHNLSAGRCAVKRNHSFRHSLPGMRL